MGRVKSKGTGPEKAVRKALRGLRLKYKLNQGNLHGRTGQQSSLKAHSLAMDIRLSLLVPDWIRVVKK